MKYICFVFLLSFFVTLYGQENIPDKTFPAPSAKSFFIYHPESEALLLIAGSALIPDSVQNNVWKWDGQKWTKIEAEGPGERAFFASALNTNSILIHSFGGIEIGIEGLNFADSKNDMWTFNGKDWTEFKVNDIGTRHHHHIVYADQLDAFVLYGGFTESGADTLTWLMENGEFKSLNIPGPGVRYQSGMVYDKNRNIVVLYGGGDNPDEHWEFDGSKWEKITTSINPGKLYHPVSIYDDNRKEVILHGGQVSLNGQDPLNNITPSTWSWNGKEWNKITDERIFHAAIGYNPIKKIEVAYGFTDFSRNSNLCMWELQNNKWIKIADYGKWDITAYLKNKADENPIDLKLLTLYANQLKSNMKFDEAETAYKKLEKVYPKKVDIWVNITEVLLLQNKIEESDKYLKKINASEVMNRNIFTRLANSLAAVKDYPKSASYFEKALEIEPRGNDFYNLTCIYALLNNKDKAFNNLYKAIENGYNNKQQIESDVDLEVLRNDDRWKAVLEKLN